MRLTRVYVAADLSSGNSLQLPRDAAHHVARVLRMQAGDALLLFDGKGHQHHAVILAIKGVEVCVSIGDAQTDVAESPLAITLVQGISRGERMDWALQKATELGVTHIIPVLTHRSVVKLDAAQALKKQEHWQGIVVSACEQSGRSVVPVVELPRTLARYVEQPAPEALRLVLDPLAEHSLHSLPETLNHIELLIGPEGGLSDEEIALAKQHGFAAVRLGPRVLRTETAAVAALAALQTLRGDLR